jgi:DNA polymerase elongation subunit (family B)
MTIPLIQFKLVDFKVIDEVEDNSEDEPQQAKFIIQIFGIDKDGKTYSFFLEDYNPFFYVKVPNSWTPTTARRFIRFMKTSLGPTHENALNLWRIKDKHTLYGFDCGASYKFIKIRFNNTIAFNRAKNMFYSYSKQTKQRKLTGLKYGSGKNKVLLELYEANIPPLLRFFHLRNISPSGWVQICDYEQHEEPLTICDKEGTTKWSNVSPYECEDKVPYKICSFDIEASSSHGDFPVAIKSYKKLATNMVDFVRELVEEDYETFEFEKIIRAIISYAFYPENMDGEIPDFVVERLQRIVERVYPKKIPSLETVQERTTTFMAIDFLENIESLESDKTMDMSNMTNYFFQTDKSEMDETPLRQLFRTDKISRESKINAITNVMDTVFPKLEGDKVTFIGSTFLRTTDETPYLNHCIALGTCDDIAGAEIESYTTEKKVLLAWTKLIQRENPDIITGYNIFGFDYKFMVERAGELGCMEKFLTISRNQGDVCWEYNREMKKQTVKQSSITLASGTHDLMYIDMPGRIQVDLYNFFRREYNLTSYKLDYVSGYFISDKVKKIEYCPLDNETIIYSKNLTGLLERSYVRFEEEAHSTDFYDGGRKFEVFGINYSAGTFRCQGNVSPDVKNKKVKWCLSKDDVSPKDIFRLSNGDARDRAIVAKYCIQDCNLVHHLMNKIDVVTGFVEMASLCSVPISFLVFRGQGIKLQSFMAKECRKKNTLMPVLEKKNDGSYEGAIVLKPKCGLYLDEPVSCVDYSSLYPSSMISENISHDSKVWTKEYDLNGRLIKEIGEKKRIGDDGEPIYRYDNMPGYSYVNITYDTYEYIPNARGKEEKTKVGYKTCRYAQFPHGKLAIVPSILKELLAYRKSTRTSAKFKTVSLKDGRDFIGLVKKGDDDVSIIDAKKEKHVVSLDDVESISDTYDDFMKNVLDKRQLAAKVTANSVYGQCGARTSSFYEKDVAASTTATGRKLLIYGKHIIEDIYNNRPVETKYGKAHSYAEYIYGDSVLGDTPITYKDKSGYMCVKRISELATNWTMYAEFKPFDTYSSNRRFKSQAIPHIPMYVMTRKGWKKVVRVIRHKCNKAIYRVGCDIGNISVTEDHSLLNTKGKKIKPTQCYVGKTQLMTRPDFVDVSREEDNRRTTISNYSAFIMGLSSRVTGFINDLFLNQSNDILKEFMNGMFYENQSNDISMVDSESCQRMYIILSRLGYFVKVKSNTRLIIITNPTNQSSKSIDTMIVNERLYDIYDDFVYDIETVEGSFHAGVGSMIIKNTDSVFESFKLVDEKDHTKSLDKELALRHTIELAKEAGWISTKFLKPPHDLEYEKTFLPFCLLSKKRYVGMLYEEDPTKCYRKSMGIVLKRRDNAPIVKDVYGGIIDILMKGEGVQEAVDFTKKCLEDIVNERYPIDKLIITKSLNGHYKNPDQIAHKVLADRIAKRDPGNKPSAGDRIPFVYFQTGKNVKKQGDKIELPSYIQEKGLKPDYMFYITNQIMKPVQQVFALVLEDIPSYKRQVPTLKKKIDAIYQEYENDVKAREKEQKIRNKEVEKLIFQDSLISAKNRRNGQREISTFFSKPQNTTTPLKKKITKKITKKKKSLLGKKVKKVSK